MLHHRLIHRYRFHLALSFIAGLGLALATPPQAQAAASDAPTVQMEPGSQNFSFKASCPLFGGFSTVSLLIGPEPEQAAGYSALEEGPSCQTKGDTTETTFSCSCRSGLVSATGTLPPLDLGNEAPLFDPTDTITAQCDALVHEHCGPFAPPIQDSCESQHGECEVRAQGRNKNGAYNDAAAMCSCASGQIWSYQVLASQDQTLAPDFASQTCQQELAKCAPAAAPGPVADLPFPADEIVVRAAHCENQKKDPDEYETCRVTEEDGYRRVECECTGEQAWASSGPIASASTTDELYGLCVQELTRCQPQVDPEGPQEDIEDILDALGCSAATQSAPLPFMAIGCLILMRRRRRY